MKQRLAVGAQPHCFFMLCQKQSKPLYGWWSAVSVYVDCFVCYKQNQKDMFCW